jgi:hypothetical protein
MNRLVRVLLGPAALVAVNITTAVVLISNHRDGLYPPAADSLGLPIGLTVLASLMSLAAFGLVAASRQVIARAGRRRTRKWVASAVLALGYVAVALFALTGLASWLVPHHYAVSLSYAVVLGWLGWELREDLVKVRGTKNAA